MTSCRSFLLAVLEEERNHVLSREEVESLFREVYVLLVRRKFAELPVTRYDSFFPSLIDRIKDGAPTDVTVLLQRAIRKEQLWVGDDEFREAFIMRPVYRSRELVFTRLVLEELDRHLAQVHGENYRTTRPLTRWSTSHRRASKAVTTGKVRWARTLSARTTRGSSIRSAISAYASVRGIRRWDDFRSRGSSSFFVSLQVSWRSTLRIVQRHGTSPRSRQGQLTSLSVPSASGDGRASRRIAEAPRPSAS